jgi:hypothetical protein
MKRYLFPIIILLFSLSVIAQGNREKVKALKVSFITEKLNLTEKEAQEFWPIYNAFEAETMKIKFEEIRAIRREIRATIETIDDAKAKELLDKLSSAENNLHNSHKLLITKLHKVISPKKIIMLKVAEDDFNKKLFQQYKNKHRGHIEKK